MEELRRSLKKAGKTCVFCNFAPKNAKFIGFFRRKTISTKPKAIRNQVTVHWDPLRNHGAEAEKEGREGRGGREGREGTEGRERRREEREEREEGGCSVVLGCCCVVLGCSVVRRRRRRRRRRSGCGRKQKTTHIGSGITITLIF